MGLERELADRLTRVEEHLGFTEHAAEQLSAEIATINRRVKEIADRLGRIEQRLAKTAEPDEDPD